MKQQKGCKYYRKNTKRQRLIIAFILLAAIIIQVVLSKVLSGTYSIFFTIMAILTVLPFGVILSPLIAILKYNSRTKEEYSSVDIYSDRGIILYDIILNTREQIMPLDFILINKDSIFVYLSNKSIRIDKTKAYIYDIIKSSKMKLKINIYTELNMYMKALSRLEKIEAADKEKLQDIAYIISNLSM